MKMKKCSRCKELKEATTENFFRESRSKDGLQYQCKVCKKQIDDTYRRSSLRHALYQKSPSFVYGQLKYQAKKRNITFALDKDYYLNNLAHQPCFYCGEPNTKHWVDRYINDHNIGYTHSNTVPCCEMCNKTKLHLHPNDWLKHCKKIVDNNI